MVSALKENYRQIQVFSLKSVALSRISHVAKYFIWVLVLQRNSEMIAFEQVLVMIAITSEAVHVSNLIRESGDFRRFNGQISCKGQVFSS